MTIGYAAVLKGKKCHGKGKGKKRAGVAAAFMGAGIQPYSPMKLPSSREAHPKAMVVSVEPANAILPSPLCTDPMLPLVTTLAIFLATLDSPSVALKDKLQVTEAGNYLSKKLATVVALVDESTPTVAALFNTIPYCKGGRQ